MLLSPSFKDNLDLWKVEYKIYKKQKNVCNTHVMPSPNAKSIGNSFLEYFFHCKMCTSPVRLNSNHLRRRIFTVVIRLLLAGGCRTIIM